MKNVTAYSTFHKQHVCASTRDDATLTLLRNTAAPNRKYIFKVDFTSLGHNKYYDVYYRNYSYHVSARARCTSICLPIRYSGSCVDTIM